MLFVDSTDKYDSRDVERLQRDDAFVEGYLMWRMYVVDDALKMIVESLQWRKEFGVNGMNATICYTTMLQNTQLSLYVYKCTVSFSVIKVINLMSAFGTLKFLMAIPTCTTKKNVTLLYTLPKSTN